MKLIELFANKSSFTTITFKRGFNFVLAQRDKSSGDKDSTNGLGKSLLLEIVNFCLGANPSETLEKEEMISWVFSLVIEIDDKNIKLSRSVDNPNLISVYDEFNTLDLPASSDGLYSIEIVKAALGYKVFGLNEDTLKGKKNKPTYRMLLSYFLRTGGTAYSDPFAYFAKQPAWSRQVNNAYLLGLDWELSTKLSQLKVKLDKLDTANKAIENGALEEFGGTVGELESEKINVQVKLEEKASRLSSFQVYEDYKHVQVRADELTSELHSLLNTTNLNTQVIEKYKSDLDNEKGEQLRVEQIYRDAGAVFNAESIRSLAEVEQFHKNVVSNRKNYLRAEVDNLSAENEKLLKKISKVSSERAEYMNILNSHGALEEFSLLQNEVSKEKAKISDIQSRISRLTEIEDLISVLRVQIENMTKQMRRDYSERLPTVKSAIKMFNSNSEYLYAHPGSLSIDVAKSGYKFKVDIKKSSSDGVSNMKVFCYDLMLAEYWSTIVKREVPLFHDSKIFADVDPRQIALALELAKSKSDQLGFQYICSMNSSYIPNEFLSQDFVNTLDDFTIVKYHDKDDSGTLLGITF